MLRGLGVGRRLDEGTTRMSRERSFTGATKECLDTYEPRNSIPMCSVPLFVSPRSSLQEIPVPVPFLSLSGSGALGYRAFSAARFP